MLQRHETLREHDAKLNDHKLDSLMSTVATECQLDTLVKELQKLNEVLLRL